MTNYFAHGRTALWFGLRFLGVSSGQKILLPEYICDVVIHPLEELEIEIIFYPVNDYFVPDWKVIEDNLKNNKVFALLIVHYFGQPQDIYRAQEISERYGAYLIEDNSHGYGGKLNGKKLGSFGAIGFSSPRKQLKTSCGGILYMNGKQVEPNVKDGKGGLRDLHTLIWISKFAYKVDTISKLINVGALTKEEAVPFAEALSLIHISEPTRPY